MSFIVDAESNEVPPKNWWKINHDEFEKYKNDFETRHKTIEGYAGINVGQEIDVIKADAKALAALKEQLSTVPEEEEYLVAQYICEAGSNTIPEKGFANLGIAFCFKSKNLKSGNSDMFKRLVTINGIEQYFIINARTGKYLSMDELKAGMFNFHNRKGYIYKELGNELFEIDKKGRAHKITDNVIGFFTSAVNLNLKFILDDNGLSIAFSQKDLGTMSILDDDGIYDHGSACCPIG